MIRRFNYAFKTYFVPPVIELFKWLLFSKEITNYTYDLTITNERYLGHFIALVTNAKYQLIMEYISEIDNDIKLKEHIQQNISASKTAYIADLEIKYGRRVGWYAFVRATKPKVIVETGVDKGLGSCVLTAALMRNDQEGFKGFYYGIDINPESGYLLTGEYTKFGQILFGDSISTLNSLNKNIDIFINDSDHSAEYEEREYDTISNKLNENAIILGDNSHATDKLLNFAEKSGRQFLFFKEEPLHHWYPGAGIGVAFRKL